MKLKSLFVLLLAGLCTQARPANDEYALPWRGVMIDVSRHFMPMSDLKRQVDAMSHFGLNRLHIHLTDAAGWRMEIKSYPRLTEVGAWRTAPDWKTWWAGNRAYADKTTGYGGYYTQDELRDLVAYAKKRGVEVIPEIEFPAHSEEVVAAYPELGFNHAEMNMLSDSVYQFMETVLGEVAQIFPSSYLHVGGDEAATQHELQPQAMRRIQKIVQGLGRKMIVWDEALSDDPADSAMVIMVWRNIDTARRAIALGHDVILSPGKWCYLDKAQDAPSTQPKAMGGYLPIDSVYALPSVVERAEDSRHLLGIQANVWTEYIENPRHAEYMLWPRAYAIAELGRVGLDGPRDVAAFHQRAILATRWLRDTLGVNAFNLGHEIGERPEKLQPVECLSTGCPVQYLHNYNSYYPASGEATLTDGKRGGWNNTDGNWQGFIGRAGMDVVIDMGSVRQISSVDGDFLQSCGPEIFLPHYLNISVSEEGEYYRAILKAEIEDSDIPEVYHQLGWQGDAVSARYVRVQALPGPRQGWIFCDEICVK